MERLTGWGGKDAGSMRPDFFAGEGIAETLWLGGIGQAENHVEEYAGMR